MPIQIVVKHRPQGRRILVGAGLFVLGVILFRSFSELAGAVIVLTGVMVGVRGAAGPILTAFACFLVVGLFVGYHFWIDPESREYGLEEYLRQNWIFVAYVVALISWQFVAYFRRNESAWSVLRADYADGFEQFGKTREYASLNGIMRVDEEYISVYVMPIADGIVIFRENDGHIFFPWTRVREIRILDHKPNTAVAEIERNIGLPLRIEIPWADQFSKSAPPGVNLVGI